MELSLFKHYFYGIVVLLTKFHEYMLQTLKNPLSWFAVLLIVFTVQNNLLDGEFKNVIRSDGRGYYAYLPAILIHDDPTFEASLEAETKNAGQNFNQYYLYKNEDGATYNKYFPGMAVLQSPFFAGGCLMAVISGAPVDGYSEPFELAFLLGSLFYVIFGLFLFSFCLKQLFPKYSKYVPWLVIGVFSSTTLLMYSTFTLGLSHHYSFFLFSVFFYLALRLRKEISGKTLFWLGITLGMIALVRPTNILVILILPYLLNDSITMKQFFGQLFTNKAKLFLKGILGFALVFSLLFIVWKWQSGNWIVWSYSGEGFNFFHPAIWENLFSFRNGLFLHSPILIVTFIGAVWITLVNRSKMLWWWLYFGLNSWVISSWWCWDYETSFGNRPFTEHVIFLILPLFYLMEKKPKVVVGALIFFATIGGMRYQAYANGFMVDQRFTAANFLPSLAIWNTENAGRWQFPRSVNPFGEKVNELVILNRSEKLEFNSATEFGLDAGMEISQNRTKEILFFRASMEKRVKKPLKDVFLVVHATNENGSKVYYKAVELFNDRLEGQNDWAEISFSGQIPDHFHEFTNVKIYLWNRGKNEFELRNIRMSIETFLDR